MKDHSITTFKRRVLVTCLIMAAMHITACCYFTFFPDGPLSRSFIGSFYKSRFLIGPFFVADRLKVSPHFLVSYKKQNEEWSAFQDDGMDKLKSYQSKPWQYHYLGQSDFSRNIGRDFYTHYNPDSSWNSNEFVTFNSYLVRKVLPPGNIDSVRLMYILKTYDAGADEVKSDTAWTLSYKLDDQPAR